MFCKKKNGKYNSSIFILLLSNKIYSYLLWFQKKYYFPYKYNNITFWSNTTLLLTLEI